MKRLAIHDFLPDRDGLNPFVCVLQADNVDALSSIVVAPLQRATRPPIRGLEIQVSVDGSAFLIVIHELTAVPRSELGAPRAVTGEQLGWQVDRALDRLLFGV